MLLSALTLLAVAAPGGPSLPEWTAMQRRLAHDRLRVRFLRREELTVKQGLKELDTDIGKKDESIEELEEAADGTRDRIEELDRRIEGIEGRLAKLREAAGRRAAAMVRLRRTSLASVLDKATTPGDTRRLRDRLRRVFEYDAKLVGSVRTASAQDREARTTLETELSKLQDTMDALEAEIEEANLLREERGALLDAISKERRASGRLLAQLLRTSRRLRAELGVVRGSRPAPERAEGGFDRQKGLLPWPVSGTVEAIFGKSVDPDSGMVVVQRGIDIRAPQSEVVRAVFDGEVVYAGRLAGLGRVMILDHDGFYSIYGHLERFHARRGARVAQFQVIGLVGDSDSIKGAFLYFELRQAKDAIDPLKWLADH